MPPKKKTVDNTAMRELKQAIKEGAPKRLYVFHGEEAFLRDDCLARLKGAILPPGLEEFNLHAAQGKDCSVDWIEQAVDCLPMMSGRTLILAADFDLFGLGDKAKERLAEILSALPDYCCLVFVYDLLAYKPPARDKLAALLKKEGAAVNFQRQEQKTLAGKLHLPVDFFYGDQKMATLSGGEKVKAQMARILMTKPTVLLLDEPSNDIDIETLEWLGLILSSGLPVLFISHDETLIERTANVVIHLEQIRRKTVCRYTVARMPYREYIQRREDLMETQRQQAGNERRQEENRQEKLHRIMQKVEHDQAAVTRQNPAGGRLLKKKMKAVKSMERRFEREAEDMTQMPEAEEAIFLKFGQDIRMPAGKVVLNLSLKQLQAEEAKGESGNATEVSGGRILARDIRLVVRGGEKVCIVGRNGVGKTTLLRRIAGELLGREDLHAAYMPQNYEELLDMARTPVEYLCTTGEREEETRIRTYLGSMKYTADEMNHPISQLSGGQKAKVLLLKMSLSGADVLILDEPTRNFSPLSAPVIREVLQEYKGAVISVSHDRKYISEVCSRVCELTEEGLMN